MPDSMITKKALASAMKSLMREKPFTKISVGDICETCGMNRKSFYYHFRDKYDLVDWIFQTEFIEAIKIPAYVTGYDLLLDICNYFYNEKTFYINALQFEGQNSFREYFSSTIESILTVIFKDDLQKAEDSHFFVSFFTDAFVTSIVRWLTDGASIPPKEFVGKLEMVLRIMAKMNQNK